MRLVLVERERNLEGRRTRRAGWAAGQGKGLQCVAVRHIYRERDAGGLACRVRGSNCLAQRQRQQLEAKQAATAQQPQRAQRTWMMSCGLSGSSASCAKRFETQQDAIWTEAGSHGRPAAAQSAV